MFKSVRNILICMAVLMSACGKKEFTVEFELPADVNANYTAIYYASDKKGGVTIENVAVVTAGKGSLRCPTVNPALLFLYTGNGIPLTVYAGRGDRIKVTGEGRDPWSWTVDGNDVNVSLSAWRNANAATLAKNIPDSTNRAVARYVTANPESEISPLLLLTAYSRNDDETGFRRLWQSLRGDALTAPWTRLAARADIPDGHAATPGRLRSIVLRSLANGIDTIRPDSAAATFLFFWNSGYDRRGQTIDSIRALAKEFPDSASRMIADVCLDPDSLSWRAPLRRDSLSGVARMWVPAGLADTRLMRLGVTRSPFFIVFSRDGHQRYRGDDSGEALKTFREICRKEKTTD